jgi:hypothetical protein
MDLERAFAEGSDGRDRTRGSPRSQFRKQLLLGFEPIERGVPLAAVSHVDLVGPPANLLFAWPVSPRLEASRTGPRRPRIDPGAELVESAAADSAARSGASPDAARREGS